MEHYYQNIGENWFSYQGLYTEMVKRYDNAKFVEIGCWRGRSACYLAVEIFNSNKNIQLYCVDTWLGSEEHKDMDVIKDNKLYDEFLGNIEPVKHIVTPVRNASLEAVKTFEDNYFDFIFIDASHDYENVLADLRAWYPKLKTGGYFAGHDYGNTWTGVNRAVDQWCQENNVRLEMSGHQSCWGLTKK